MFKCSCARYFFYSSLPICNFICMALNFEKNIFAAAFFFSIYTFQSFHAINFALVLTLHVFTILAITMNRFAKTNVNLNTLLWIFSLSWTLCAALKIYPLKSYSIVVVCLHHGSTRTKWIVSQDAFSWMNTLVCCTENVSKKKQVNR